jgi:predicted nucleotidyltransferase
MNAESFCRRKNSRIRPRIDTVRMDNPPLSATTLADIIREICKTHAIPLNAVVLFGSHTTGKAGEQSDRDFLIITKEPITHRLKRKITTEIRKRIVFDFDADVDLLVLPENEISSCKTDTGRTSYYALKDGLVV